MKKLFFALSALLTSFVGVQSQTLSEIPNFDKYQSANKELIGSGEKVRVVFLGNSITEAWPNASPAFFAENQYAGRGISGQTSPQLLLRFRQDVLELKPLAVVINIGTNDVATNTGAYNPQYTLDCIMSMAEIANANNIKVILSSVLPSGGFSWRPEVKDAPEAIDILNYNIKQYAEKKGFAYIDYNTAMRDERGAMQANLGNDGVHPNSEGYTIMEEVAKAVIETVLSLTE